MTMSKENLEKIASNDLLFKKHMLEKIEKLEENQSKFLVDIAVLKVKNGFFAGLFGTLGGFIAVGIAYLKKP